MGSGSASVYPHHGAAAGFVMANLHRASSHGKKLVTRRGEDDAPDPGFGD